LLGSLKVGIADYLEKLAARRADRIIATSQFTLRWLVEQSGLPQAKVTVINEFIDTAQFTPVRTDFRERFSVPPDSQMILFVARMEPRKGPLVLAKAIPLVLQTLPQAKFIIIGGDTNLAPDGGSMRAFIERLAESQGFLNNLIFTGMIPTADVVGAYSACDVFVYPGLLEAGGLPPLEAMACNCSVVATATGISAELKNASPTFLVVPPGDHRALAEAIVQLLSMPNHDRVELSCRHRKIVEERFNFQRMVDQILSVYEDVINR
jgi:glycosyltransferase involved in cell wall biosynthesis